MCFSFSTIRGEFPFNLLKFVQLNQLELDCIQGHCNEESVRSFLSPIKDSYLFNI